MEKILAGDYTYKEFRDLVLQWRERHHTNKLSVTTSHLFMKYFENLRVIYLPDKVRLEEIT